MPVAGGRNGRLSADKLAALSTLTGKFMTIVPTKLRLTSACSFAQG